MAKGLALDLGPPGITVNVVAPRMVRVAPGRRLEEPPRAGRRGPRPHGQGRWGAPTDLAGAYQFLASDSSAFITGTVLDVDGGYLS